MSNIDHRIRNSSSASGDWEEGLSERHLDEDLVWAQTNPELERQFLGEYVILWKRQVVAHGTDLQKALEEATTPERPADQLVIVGFPSFFETPH